MTNKNVKMSIHKFCLSRAIPMEMETKFIKYFHDFFVENFSEKEDYIFNYLVSEMFYEEILDFWNAFLKHLRYSLPET